MVVITFSSGVPRCLTRVRLAIYDCTVEASAGALYRGHPHLSARLTVSPRVQAVGGDSSDKEKHKDTLLECIETMQQVYTATQKLYEEHGLLQLP